MIQYKREKNFQVEQIKRLFESVNWYSGKQPEKLQIAFQNSTRGISAWDGDELVGLIRGMDDGIWQANIDCLLVHPKMQGQGIASELVRQLLQEYKDFLYIYVVPDEKKNVPFYEKQGFKVMDEGTPLLIKGTAWER